MRGVAIPFESFYKELLKYKDKYHDCSVPYRYVTESGMNLGYIVSRIRTGKRKITEEEKARLDLIGFVWKCRLSMDDVIKIIEIYKKEHKNCLIPRNYVTENGIRLGEFVNNIRAGARKTSDEEKARLNSIGFIWNVQKWKEAEEMVRLIEQYQV